MNDEDDTDFFMNQSNDSQSSLGVGNLRDLHVDASHETIQPPVDRLPPELLILIFSKLGSPQDLFSCILVSRKWATNCVGLLWHRPLCSNEKKLIQIANAVSSPDTFFHYSGMIKRLNLSALGEDANDGTLLSFRQCKRIERLTLTNCAELTDRGVADVVKDNGHLQALDVTGLKSITDHTLFVVSANCRRLQGLNITGCINISDNALIELANNCRLLKRVGLSDPCLLFLGLR